MAWGTPLDSSVTIIPSESGLLTGVELEDNTATAFSIGEGASDYVTITTTDAGEKVNVLKNTEFAAGTTVAMDVIAEKTTNLGVTIDGLRIKDKRINWDVSDIASGDAGIDIKDNLAQALSIKEGSNNYVGIVTTNGSERIAITQRMTVTDGVSSGTARIVGGMASVSAAASTAITGATETLTNFDTTYTLPPNSLKVGTRVRIRAGWTNTAITGTETYVIVVRAGSTAIAGTPSIAPSGSGTANNVGRIDFEFVCRATGASGTVVGDGVVLVGVDDTTPSRHYLVASGSAGTRTVTLDTTGSLVLAIGNQWQASATDSNSNRLEYFWVEIVG